MNFLVGRRPTKAENIFNAYESPTLKLRSVGHNISAADGHERPQIVSHFVHVLFHAEALRGGGTKAYTFC